MMNICYMMKSPQSLIMALWLTVEAVAHVYLSIIGHHIQEVKKNC